MIASSSLSLMSTVSSTASGRMGVSSTPQKLVCRLLAELNGESRTNCNADH